MKTKFQHQLTGRRTEYCLALVGNSAGNFGLSRFYTRHRNPAGSGWLDGKLPWENQQGRHCVR